ncbi:MAG: S49 family peptidase [Planctomycetes bacterium]|nr:S49 family peptidase [Planctomycetota bacterium]
MISRSVRMVFHWLWLAATLPLWLPLLLLGPGRYSIVRVEIATPLPELGRAAGLARFFKKPRLGLWEIYELLRACRRDRGVRAVHLVFAGAFDAGTATAQTLARLIDSARATGVKVLVSADFLDSRLLLAAARADRIAMPPAAPVFVPGHSAEVPFVADLLDSLGVRVETVRIGEYKTAADSLVQSDLSSAHREMLQSLLADLQEQYVASVAEGRRLDPAKVRELAGRAYFDSDEAKEAGLVDRILYPDQVDDWLKEETGAPARTVDAARFLARHRRLAALRRHLAGGRPRIAVLLAEGMVLSEKSRRVSPRAVLSAESLSGAFKAARKIPSIRGAILRVNSPGGSGAESELLWREVSRLAEEKPVVVSMGDVAASGGYYFAAPARRILALPGTLTGSIGVLSGKLDLSRALARFGVRVARLAASPGASLFSPSRPFDREGFATVDRQTRRFYSLFLSRVAEGRGLTVEEVDALGQGRVWTGKQAQAARLADAVGGLEEAVAVARELAGLGPEEPVDLVFCQPAQPMNLRRLLLGRSAAETLLEPLAPAALALLSPEPLAWWPEAGTIR